MRITRTLIAAALAIALIASAAPATSAATPAQCPVVPAPTPTPAPVPTVDARVSVIHSAHNAYRLANGKSALALHPGLTSVAQRWSERMAAEQLMYHNPNFVAEAPAGWTRIGENVAYTYVTPGVASANHVMQMWQNSAPHRGNMLGDYTHMGIGVAERNGATYVTVNFARY